jgi:hypothetical protein
MLPPITYDAYTSQHFRLGSLRIDSQPRCTHKFLSNPLRSRFVHLQGTEQDFTYSVANSNCLRVTTREVFNALKSMYKFENSYILGCSAMLSGKDLLTFTGTCCLRSPLWLEAASTSETSVTYQTTQYCSSKDSDPYPRRYENLKSIYNLAYIQNSVICREPKKFPSRILHVDIVCTVRSDVSLDFCHSGRKRKCPYLNSCGIYSLWRQLTHFVIGWEAGLITWKITILVA